MGGKCKKSAPCFDGGREQFKSYISQIGDCQTSD